MFNVLIKNLEGKHTHGINQVETIEEANAWIAEQTAVERPFGYYYKDRWLQEPLEGVETRIVRNCECEESCEHEVVEYLHPQNFSIEVVDVTEELAHQKLVDEAKMYLNSTDWIMAKISEEILVHGKTKEELEQKYSVELQKRVEYRQLLNMGE